MRACSRDLYGAEFLGRKIQFLDVFLATFLASRVSPISDRDITPAAAALADLRYYMYSSLIHNRALWAPTQSDEGSHPVLHD